MKTSSCFYVSALIALAIGCSIPTTKTPADPRFARGAVVNKDDPGCETLALVSTGGAFPKDPKTLAIRWTGYTNFELVYNGQVILLDAHFDRGSMFPPLGFKAADVKRANVDSARAWTSRSYVGCCFGRSANRSAGCRRASDNGKVTDPKD